MFIIIVLIVEYPNIYIFWEETCFDHML